MQEHELKELLELYLEFIQMFNRNKVLFKEKNRQANPCNKNQNNALVIIGKSKRIMPSTLANDIDIEKGSLTTLIDSLGQMGLVFKEDDPDDRRKMWLSLSPKGLAQFNAIEEQYLKKLISVVSVLDRNEIDEMKEGFKTLIRLFKKIQENY